MLEHLYGHRAGANVRNSRRAAGSRERGRHDVRGWHGNSIPEGFNSLSNLEQASDKRDANHVPPVLVATDRNSVRSRWYIGAELWALVAVDHLIYAFVSCTSSSGFARRQLYRACEARTVLPTSASRGFLRASRWYITWRQKHTNHAMVVMERRDVVGLSSPAAAPLQRQALCWGQRPQPQGRGKK